MTLALDHIVVGAATLEQGRVWVREALGVEPIVGGRHAFMGTHNLVLRLDGPGSELYLEILAVDPQAPAPRRPRWFDMDDPVVRSTLEAAPTLLAWVARSDDLDADVARSRDAGFDPGPVHATERDTPTGTLRWRITIPDDGRRLAGGAVPTLIAWDTPSPAGSLPASGLSLERLLVRGAGQIVAGSQALTGVEVEPPDGSPLTVTLSSALGKITLDAVS